MNIKDKALNIIKEEHKAINSQRALKQNQIISNNNEIAKLISEKKLLGLSYLDNEISEKEFEKQTDDIIAKIKFILKNINEEDNIFEEAFNCTKCMDTGFINNSPCKCLLNKIESLKKYSDINIRILNKDSFENFNLELFSDKKGNNKISPRENIEKNKLKAFSFIQNFNNDDMLGMLFMGTTGTGKSFLAHAIARELWEKGKDVIVLTAFELEERLTKFNDADYKKILYPLFNYELLVLDDLGCERQTDFINKNLFKLIDHRLSYGLKTIITTNLTINELLNMYGSRIYSRLIGNYIGLNFYGDDIRLIKKLKGIQ